MIRISRADVIDSLIPDRPMTAEQVAHMLALRGCLEDDGRDAEDRVRRHLSALAKDGRVRRAERGDAGRQLWLLSREPSQRPRHARPVA